MGRVQWWTLLWILRYCHTLSAEVLVQYKYFISGDYQEVSLQAPAEPKGKEFIWEWTSPDGRYTNARIITMQSNEKFSWNLKSANISKQGKYDLSLKPELENAGVFTFIQTKPEKVNLVQFEVFAVEVKSLRSQKAPEGSDVTMSCEVSHLPDSATLAWERDREPTANTTLIYNNTAHIIIHSVDQHSEGTYNCTLRRNGTLIFSVPNELIVLKETLETRHTLYRGSLNSSEVVLICHSLSSYTKASWSWLPVSETQAISVVNAGKHENVSISMEMDKERFSSDVFDGYKFPLRISPVKFGDSGMNQPVVLNCEISQVIGTVTLAWLRMKGGRGELVNLSQPSLRSDQSSKALQDQCSGQHLGESPARRISTKAGNNGERRVGNAGTQYEPSLIGQAQLDCVQEGERRPTKGRARGQSGAEY
ncbi:uncharacterized protein LOC133123661 [Conger conger]|uniref:uncharacterized protein LOC133123661 n=1 Tax=Conger conger TaxID=82655 RepID=UPI002A5B0760|nr:uncharacterized protein LOC133123661 [Conger conger]